MDNHFIIVFGIFAVFATFVAGDGTAVIENYPSLAHVDSLHINFQVWQRHCAASILNNLYVLSAAQCFSGLGYNPTHRRVQVGTSQMNGGWFSYVGSSTVHPDYGLDGYGNDICVVRLINRLVFSSRVARASLMPQDFVIPNERLIHAGWAGSSMSSFSFDLREVALKIYNHDLCREQYTIPNSPSNVTENMICTTFEVERSDFCRGDLGGPLYYRGIVAGIISWGIGCVNATYPQVSTIVSSYTDWIASTAV